MCFVALWYRVVPDYSIVLAANRDERLGRASLGPHRITPDVFAGKDLEAGGTWLGINRSGLLAAVANVGLAPSRSGVRSRGLLCLDVLQSADVEQAVRRLRDEVRLNPYNDFNLLAADRKGATVATHYGERLVFQALGPGVHVIGNSTPDDPADAKCCRGRLLLSSRPRDLDEALEQGRTICRDHGTPDGTGGVCVHLGQSGTVSSTLIALHDSRPALDRYLHAAGPPCTTPYEELQPFRPRALHHVDGDGYHGGP